MLTFKELNPSIGLKYIKIVDLYQKKVKEPTEYRQTNKNCIRQTYLFAVQIIKLLNPQWRKEK
jgi:hypothetical protein